MEHVCAAAGFFPHPPIMLPEIGGPELSKMAATVEAVEAASALIVSQKPETLVIVSPHNYVFPDGAAIILGVIATAACGLYLFLIWATVVEVAHHVAGWFAHLTR